MWNRSQIPYNTRQALVRLPVLLKEFLMISLALENKNVLFLTKDDASDGMGCFQK
jgi:hypothetical protein